MVDGKGKLKDHASKADNARVNVRKENTDDEFKLGSLLVANSTKLLEELLERKELLAKIEEVKKQSIKKAPVGKLHIAKRGKYRSYYNRKNSKDISGEYIKRENINLAYQLAQTEYDEKVIEHISNELNVIDGYINDVRVIENISLNNKEIR